MPLLCILQGTTRSLANAALLRGAIVRTSAPRQGSAAPSRDNLFRRRNTDRVNNDATGILARRLSRHARPIGVDRMDNRGKSGKRFGDKSGGAPATRDQSNQPWSSILGQ